MTERKRFGSVWNAIEDSPKVAASLRARSELMIGISEFIRKKELSQTDAAAILGVSQPRMSDLMRGKIERFSLDMLMDMASIAGLAPRIEIASPASSRRKALRAAS
jgi:predicted XRE-type DNA-binding protein